MIYRYAPANRWLALLLQGWRPLCPAPGHHGRWSVLLYREATE